MAIDRSTILRGPAIVQMGGQSIYFGDDLKVEAGLETFPVNSSAYGKVDERVKDIYFRISGTPVGQWTTALLAILYPWTNPIAGTSMFTATDVPVTVWPLNGSEKLVFAAGAVTKMPGLVLSAVKTAFGSMEITCIGKNNTAMTAADKRYVLTASASFTDSTFAVSQILTVPYTVSLAGETSPWDGIKPREAVTVDFSLKNAPVEVDEEGIVDLSLVSLDVAVKLAPTNVTVAQALTKLKVQGSGVARGVSIAADAANMTITGGTGNPIVVVNKVRLVTTPQVYGAQALRHGELEFRAVRAAGSGAMFSVGVA